MFFKLTKHRNFCVFRNVLTCVLITNMLVIVCEIIFKMSDLIDEHEKTSSVRNYSQYIASYILLIVITMTLGVVLIYGVYEEINCIVIYYVISDLIFICLHLFGLQFVSTKEVSYYSLIGFALAAYSCALYKKKKSYHNQTSFQLVQNSNSTEKTRTASTISNTIHTIDNNNYSTSSCFNQVVQLDII